MTEIGIETEQFARGRQSENVLHLTLDRKVSPDGSYQQLRHRWVPSIPNSFGLPAGESCPGMTEFCEDCYGARSEQSKGVKESLDHNLRMLQEAGSVEAMTELLTEAVSRYDNYANQKQIADDERIFRIHWDGDFFSLDYAKAWANTIRKFPHVQFWAYTRSFRGEVNVVPELVGIENLALYLSTDEENVEDAHAVIAEYPEVLLAGCADDYRTARELLRGRRSVVCPENVGRIALMTKGKGACVTCKLCPEGKVDILFSTSHVEDLVPQLRLPIEVPVNFTKKQQPVKPAVAIDAQPVLAIQSETAVRAQELLQRKAVIAHSIAQQLWEADEDPIIT